MPIHLCRACGTSFPEADSAPPNCPICEDERQYVPPSGQAWITAEGLAAGHRNAWEAHGDGLLSVVTVPKFGIGQRAFVVQTAEGNVLWDCISLLDPATVALVRGLGGLRAIAISHPHYYSAMQDWAEAFGCPVHLHAADAAWIMRPHPAIRLWDGETLTLWPGLTLVRGGGHFAGGTVLHWEWDGGVLLAGDIVQVTPGADRVSMLWSYPNMLPLGAAEVRRVAARLAPWRYRRIFGAFAGQDVREDGSGVVARSAARLLELLAPG